MSKLISLKEAAGFFGVSESHMRRMISCQKFPFYRLGSRLIRVDPEEIRQANLGTTTPKKSVSLRTKNNIQTVHQGKTLLEISQSAGNKVPAKQKKAPASWRSLRGEKEK